MIAPCVIGRMDVSSKMWSGLYERNKESQSCSLRGGVFPCHNSHPSNSSVIKDLRFEMVMDRARSASTCALAACSRLLFLFSTCRHACCILRAPLNFCQQWVWLLFFTTVQSQHNVTSSTGGIQSDKLIQADLAGLFNLLVTCSVCSTLMKSSLSPVHLNSFGWAFSRA